jgi:hypothetical protein
MITAEFLRRQAENCLRIARSCFDLGSAERLRLMAIELQAKADEIDRRSDLRSRFAASSETSFQNNERG